jgi:hypothetical protein
MWSTAGVGGRLSFRGSPKFMSTTEAELLEPTATADIETTGDIADPVGALLDGATGAPEGGADAAPEIPQDIIDFALDFNLPDSGQQAEQDDTNLLLNPAEEAGEGDEGAESPAAAGEQAAGVKEGGKAAPGGAAAGAKKPAAEAGKEAAPGEGTADDPELTPEQNAIINSRPEAERGELRETFKAASFEGHYLNPKQDIAEVAGYLKGRSPSRYAELVRHSISEGLAEPQSFLTDLYNADSETYGRFALSVVDAAPDFFASYLAGRETTVEELRAGSVAGYDGEIAELDERAEADLRAFFPAEADGWIARIKGGGAKAPEQPATATQPPRREEATAKPDAEQPKADEQPKQEAEQPPAPDAQAVLVENFTKGVEHVETFLHSLLDGAEGMALAVTPEERQKAPEVALFKDFKREALMQGRAASGLPDFETGFAQWAKDNPTFVQAVTRMTEFAKRGELDNVIRAAEPLKPLAEKYMKERAGHKYILWLDRKIASAAAQASRAPKAEKAVTGRKGGSPTPKAQNSVEAFFDEALDYGIT